MSRHRGLRCIGITWSQLGCVAASAWCCIFALGITTASSVTVDGAAAADTPAALRQFGEKIGLDSHSRSVMRREKLPRHRSASAASGAEFFQEDDEQSGSSLSASSFLFGGHETRARQRAAATPCNAYDCGLGKLVKRVNDQPVSCAIAGSCSEEECCVGTCPGFQCPAGTHLQGNAEIVPSCAGLTCRPEECCFGTCENHTCPSNSGKKPLGELPEVCNAYECDADECCYGECPGITCPSGASFKALEEQPSLCNYYPCQHSECCESKCTASLCTERNFSKVLFPGAGNMSCDSYPCTAEECCWGTCKENVCTATQPLDVHLQPEVCNDFHCTTFECCTGACNSSFCSTLPHKEPREDAGQCSARTCTDEECCLGTCSDDMCPTEFSLVPKGNFAVPSRCKSWNCTTEECCNGICSNATCPSESGLSLKIPELLPHMCGDYACTEAECCNGICTADTCRASEGKTMMDNPPSVCSGAVCNVTECCEDLAPCTANVCSAGKVLDPAAPRWCDNTTCTSSQCCTDPGQCASTDCTTVGWALKTHSDRPAACSNAACTEAECCEKARYVYWLEKVAGVIRRCRHNACDHDSVEVIKENLILPEGLAFDHGNGKLYFTDTDKNQIYRCTASNCDEETELMQSDAHEPVRLALDNQTGMLYWTQHASNQIYRCSVTSAPCTKTLVLDYSSDIGNYYGLALDVENEYLYFTVATGVYRCSLKSLPCTPVAIATGLTSTDGITYDHVRRKLYWTSLFIIEEKSTVSTSSGAIEQITSGVDSVHGITVDAESGTLYMSDALASGTMSKVRTCDVLSCADPTILISGCPGANCMNMPWDIVLDWPR